MTRGDAVAAGHMQRQQATRVRMGKALSDREGERAERTGNGPP